MNEVREKEINEIWKITQEIMEIKDTIVASHLKLGILLLQAKENEKYRLYGNHINKFEDYLQEVGISKYTAQRHMRAAKLYLKDKDINIKNIMNTNLSLNKLILVGESLKKLPQPEDKKELLEISEHSTENQIKQFVREKIGAPVCHHYKTVVMEYCPTCGRKWIIEEKNYPEGRSDD